MSSPQHEPTMEEILASIRKIISEDTPEAAPAAEAAAAPPEAAKQELQAEPEIDVLELTQEVFEEPVAASEPPPKVDHKPDDIVFEPVQEAPQPAPVIEGIFSDQTRQAMEDTFASISTEPETPAPAPRPAAAPLAAVGGASVENVFERAVRESFEPVMAKYLSDNSGVVIERMKPLIREWMDEHFPALLEGAVRTEIERVVKAGGRR